MWRMSVIKRQRKNKIGEKKFCNLIQKAKKVKQDEKEAQNNNSYVFETISQDAL